MAGTGSVKSTADLRIASLRASTEFALPSDRCARRRAL